MKWEAGANAPVSWLHPTLVTPAYEQTAPQCETRANGFLQIALTKLLGIPLSRVVLQTWTTWHTQYRKNFAPLISRSTKNVFPSLASSFLINDTRSQRFGAAGRRKQQGWECTAKHWSGSQLITVVSKHFRLGATFWNSTHVGSGTHRKWCYNLKVMS